MDCSFAMLVAPLGCYSVGGAAVYMQRETQSFIRDRAEHTDLRARKALIRLVLSSSSLTREIIAAVETHFYRTCPIAEWHALTDQAKTLKVRGFITNVRSTAHKQLTEVVA